MAATIIDGFRLFPSKEERHVPMPKTKSRSFSTFFPPPSFIHGQTERIAQYRTFQLVCSAKEFEPYVP